MEHDARPFLLALTAMNMKVIAEMAARTGSVEAASKQMDDFEVSILDYINKLQIALKPDESDADLGQLRSTARDLVSEWMASFRFK